MILNYFQVKKHTLTVLSRVLSTDGRNVLIRICLGHESKCGFKVSSMISITYRDWKGVRASTSLCLQSVSGSNSGETVKIQPKVTDSWNEWLINFSLFIDYDSSLTISTLSNRVRQWSYISISSRISRILDVRAILTDGSSAWGQDEDATDTESTQSQLDYEWYWRTLWQTHPAAQDPLAVPLAAAHSAVVKQVPLRKLAPDNLKITVSWMRKTKKWIHNLRCSGDETATRRVLELDDGKDGEHWKQRVKVKALLYVLDCHKPSHLPSRSAFRTWSCSSSWPWCILSFRLRPLADASCKAVKKSRIRTVFLNRRHIASHLNWQCLLCPELDILKRVWRRRRGLAGFDCGRVRWVWLAQTFISTIVLYPQLVWKLAKPRPFITTKATQLFCETARKYCWLG